MQIRSLIKQAISNNSKLISGLLFAIMFAATFRVLGIIVLRKIFDDVLIINLPLWVLLFFAAITMYFVLDSIRISSTTKITSQMSRTLRYSIFKTIMRSELQELAKHPVDQIVETIDDGCNQITNTYAKDIIHFVYQIITMIAIVIAGLVVNAVLTMVFLGFIPFYYGIYKGIEKLTSSSSKKREAIEERGQTQIKEAIEQLRFIKLKNGIIQKEEDFGKWLDEFATSEKRNAQIKHIFITSLPIYLVHLVVLIIIGLGGWMVLNDTGTTLGDLVAFGLFSPILFFAFKSAIETKFSSSHIEDSIAQLEKLITIRSELRSEPVQSLEDVHVLKFQDVTVLTDAPDKGIEQMTFEVKRGESFGLLTIDSDSSSVLFDLITKIIRPKSGTITINNCDINKLDTFYLRDIVTAIPERGAIFKDTIQNNIIYPLEFDEYQYNDALNRSGLKEFIYTLDKRDQTIVSETSDLLTNEQKQRIIIASAFYKNSKIFVLNEATELLSPKSEDEVLKEILKLKNKITIICSKRVYNLLNCDKIMVVEQNKVVEYGKTSELLQNRESMLSKQIKRGKLTRSTRVS